MQRLSTLAFRNLRVRPIRTLLTAAGIILGVAVIVSISIANQSIYDGFKALFTDVAGSAHLTIETPSRAEDGFNGRVLEQIQRVEGVRLAVPSTVNGTMLMLGDREVSLQVYGVDPAVDASVRPYKMVEGGFLTDERKYTVVVVKDLADEYDIEVGEDITLLGADGPEQLLVVGIMAKEGPARRAKMVMPLLVSQEIFARGRKVDAIDIVAEEEIAQYADSLDRLKAALQSEVGDSLEVLYPAARAESIAEALQGISLGLSFFAITALFSGAYLIFNTFSMTVVERMREIGMLRAVGATKGQNSRLLLSEAVILGVAGSLFGLVLGVILAVPMTKIWGGAFGLEWGVFSVRPAGLVGGFLVGMVVTLVSALIPAIRAGRVTPIEALTVRGREKGAGWLIRHGWEVGLALVVVSELISCIPVREETMQMGIGQMSFLLLLAGVTLLVPRMILILAIHASRMSPTEALIVREREWGASWLIRHDWKVGLALTVLGLILQLAPNISVISQMGFPLLLAGVTLFTPRIIGVLIRPAIPLIYGNEGRIGSGNVNRALGRTAVTVGALMMGVLMLIVIGAQTKSMMADVESWMDAAFRGDLFISSFQPMRLELAEDLAAVEGVHAVTPMRFQSVKVVGALARTEGYASDEIAFIAVDPLEYARISEFEFTSGQGDEGAMVARLAEGDAVFISTTIRDRYDIAKGDTICLRTARGELDFLVAGVIVDYTWGGWSVTGSWKDLEQYFRTNKADVFLVDVAPEASVDQVRQRIEDVYGKRRHIDVESGQEYRDRWLGEFMSIWTIFRVIVVIGVIVAALGVTNTMMMNVLERIREIGCLRAVGMTRWQVVRMILAEALITGIVGGLLGLGFGALSSYFAVQGMAEGAGWEVTLVLPTSLLAIGLAVALGVSQIASLYPAWRATKINIIRAVQYE